jgi:chromosome segregation ATPase
MFDFNEISHKDLNSKISDFENKINSVSGVHRMFISVKQDEWDEIFTLSAEISQDFKKVRYPTRQEREDAWQKYFDLRDKAFKEKKEQLEQKSGQHYKELMSQLNSADYSALGDFIASAIPHLAVTVQEMKERGRALAEAAKLFKSVKHEMTNEDKTLIHTKITEVRENHDEFWEKYKSYQEERNSIYQDKQEKGKEIKARIEANTEANKDKLEQAEESLEKLERQKSKLEDDIDESTSENWKSKAEGWLDECNDKIKSKEEYIERLKKWIEEGEDKLRNWN